MSAENVRQVLWVTIETLVKSEGSLQERLASAYRGSLNTLPAENGLPKEYQEVLESIRQDMTNEPAKGNEGSIEATTRNLEEQEAERVAPLILSLYIKLRGGI